MYYREQRSNDMKSLFRVVSVSMLALVWAGPAHAICAGGTVNVRLNCLATQLAAAQLQITGLQADLAAAEATIATLEASSVDGLADYVWVDSATSSVMFEGANVFVLSGSGATDGAVNGYGNLFMGYNEDAYGYARTGSHNLVIGGAHGYSSYGGLLAGYGNVLSARYCSVTGGESNEASSAYSVVSGGWSGLASGDWSSVSGGIRNLASGAYSSVLGGIDNVASGDTASVSGGDDNTASGQESAICGGRSNTASAEESSVSGGTTNTASGRGSTVYAGRGVTVSAQDDYGP